MDPASVESIRSALILSDIVVLDVRGEEEAARLGNVVDGSIKLEYKNDDELFEREVISLLPAEKNTAIICH